MCWHNWTKWGEIDVQKWHKYRPDIDKTFDYVRMYQWRECQKCGRKQRREIK